MVQARPEASLCRLSPMARRPTLTTELSMKARLDARTVVTSTPVECFGRFKLAARSEDQMLGLVDASLPTLTKIRVRLLVLSQFGLRAVLINRVNDLNVHPAQCASSLDTRCSATHSGQAYCALQALFGYW